MSDLRGALDISRVDNVYLWGAYDDVAIWQFRVFIGFHAVGDSWIVAIHGLWRFVQVELALTLCVKALMWGQGHSNELILQVIIR